jgi:hypothetical protein
LEVDLLIMARFLTIVERVRRIIADRYRMTPVEFAFARHFQARARISGDGPLVLVQNTEDKFFYLIFGELVTALRRQSALRVDQYVSRSIRPDSFGSLRAFLRTRFYWNILTDRKWQRLYGAFCDRVAWRAAALHWPWREASYALRAWRVWRHLSSKDELTNLEADGVRIGDLVIDAYLRFNSAPEVKLEDRALLSILRQAFKDVASAKAYFRRNRPALFITSYTVYLQHGVAVRVAAQHGIRIMAFGNLQEFGTEVTPDHLCHTKRDYTYHQDFLRLPDQDRRIQEAEHYLSARLSGAIDTATAYMKESAYAVTVRDVPDSRQAVVVFMHDFFDSANVYRNMVFADFWEWLKVTVDLLSEAGLPFLIKPHPNQSPESARELERFVRENPGVKVISPKVTNAQLVAGGMICGVTAYGTVASELAFLGVPSICCSDNPFVSFDFCRTARSRDQYADYLRAIPEFAPDKAMMRRQACIFDYMHNLNLDKDKRALRDAFVTAWMGTVDLHRNDERDPARFFSYFDDITQNAAFRALISQIWAQISVPNSIPQTHAKVISACSPMHRS